VPLVFSGGMPEFFDGGLPSSFSGMLGTGSFQWQIADNDTTISVGLRLSTTVSIVDRVEEE